MAWKDPIVEEIHHIRAEIMKEHDNDLHKLFEHLRERQRISGRKYTTLSRDPSKEQTGGQTRTK